MRSGLSPDFAVLLFLWACSGLHCFRSLRRPLLSGTAPLLLREAYSELSLESAKLCLACKGPKFDAQQLQNFLGDFPRLLLVYKAERRNSEEVDVTDADLKGWK